MKNILTLLILLLLSAKVSGQIPPPPPPPPPTDEEIQRYKEEDKNRRFDFEKSKPIAHLLQKEIKNNCEGKLRNIKGSSLNFSLPETYKQSGYKFEKDEYYWIKVMELPPYLKFLDIRDSIIKLFKTNTDIEFKQFVLDFTINGNQAVLIENAEIKHGFCSSFLIVHAPGSDFLIHLSYDLIDQKNKTIIQNAISSICFKEGKKIDPMSELSIEIDTSITHFVPQRAGKQMVLFTTKASAAQGLQSLEPKFQITESIELSDKPNDELFADFMNPLNNMGYSIEVIQKETFKVNGLEAESREIKATIGKIQMNMYLVILRPDEGLIVFTGMTMYDNEKYYPLWKKTVESIKLK